MRGVSRGQIPSLKSQTPNPKPVQTPAWPGRVEGTQKTQGGVCCQPLGGRLTPSSIGWLQLGAAMEW